VIDRIMANLSIKVSILNNPINILDSLEKLHPDILLLDVVMPGLSGYDIARIVRATEKWAHLPIIFLTAKGDDQSREAALQAGGNDFLVKPIIPADLLG
jgi:DNA-binding response OmpR family regulator